MLKVNLDILQTIERGVKPQFKVVVYFQEPETYTEDDYLMSVGNLSTSMSEGRYEIANTTVTLKNENYYFSKRLAKELPNNKLVEIYIVIPAEAGIQEVLIFRGIVPKENGWTLTETTLTLNINA